MSGWAGTTYSSPEEMKPRCDGVFWYWQLQTHAYWLLEEVDGFNMDDWAWAHSDGGLAAKFRYFFAKTGINMQRILRLNMIKREMGL